MANILGLHRSGTARQRIAEALAVDRSCHVLHRIEWLPDKAALIRSLRKDPEQIVILDPYLDGELQLPVISWLTDHGALSGLILYLELGARPARELLHLGRIGIRWVVTMNVDDGPLALRRVVALATHDQPSQRFLQNVKAVLTPQEYKTFEFVFEGAVRSITVADVASGLGCSLRQLYRNNDSGRLPAPGRLIQWCRVLHAIRLLSDTHRSCSQAAQMLGFSDPSNMRRLVRSVTGLSASELLQNGGLIAVQSALLTSLSPLPEHNLRARLVS